MKNEDRLLDSHRLVIQLIKSLCTIQKAYYFNFTHINGKKKLSYVDIIF